MATRSPRRATSEVGTKSRSAVFIRCSISIVWALPFSARCHERRFQQQLPARGITELRSW
ncbi:hypothetical protein UG54_01305 [Gordonia sihwensis]|nr:hypothetical protein UG54_01305 [Gordonia sihwensis]